MRRSDFGTWGSELSREDFACALAAMGVLWAGRGSWPQPNDLAILIARLEETYARARDNVLRWRPLLRPSPGDFSQPTRAELLAEAWKGSLRYRYARLEIEPDDEDPLWVAQELSSPAVGVGSIFVHVEPPSPAMDWRWPFRVGLLPDEGSRQLRERLESRLSERRWREDLLDFVDATAVGVVSDLLVLPAGLEGARSLLLEAPAPLRAHCLLLVPQGEPSSRCSGEEVRELMALTQAKGLILLSPHDPAPEERIAGLIEEVSHNQPLDTALWPAWNLLEEKGPEVKAAAQPLLFASQPFLKAFRVSAFAAGLGRRLLSVEAGDIELTEPVRGRGGEPGRRTIEIDPEMSRHLGLPAGPHPADEVGSSLEGSFRGFAYHFESEEATTVAKLSRASEGKPALRTEPPAETAAARFLRGRVYADRAGPRRPLAGGLLAGSEHTLEVSVGPPEEGQRSADVPFPEEEPPPGEAGHILTVVVSEPEVIPQPLVSTIFLPRRGPSSTCRFRFSVGKEVRRFEGRIVVLHENRVLQSALLRARVLSELPDRELYERPERWPRRRPEREVRGEREEPEPDEPAGIELVIESVVRSRLGGLDGRSRFGASIVLNHSTQGTARGLRVRGYRATLSSLENIEEFVDRIRTTFNECDWEGGSYDRLDGEETVKLLRTLARHGSLLFKGVRDLVGDLPPEQPIQMVAAVPEARLPVEFCYEKAIPNRTAGLCPNARTALREMRCQPTCPGEGGQSSVICPLGFWCTSRIIEWHRFQRPAPGSNGWRFAITEPDPDRASRLDILRGLLLAASERVKATSLRKRLHKLTGVRVARSWQDWCAEVKSSSPTLLALMVHTELDDEGFVTMEIGGDWLARPDLTTEHLWTGPPANPPVVLLLGCETSLSEVQFQGLVTAFRQEGAAIVVSTTAELLDEHAPRLAEAFVEELRRLPEGETRTFGEVMLAVRRQCLLDGLPIVLCLVAYGDADWWI